MSVEATPEKFAFTGQDREGNTVNLWADTRVGLDGVQIIASINNAGTLVELDQEGARMLSYWLAANTPSPSDDPKAACPECGHLMSEHFPENGCAGMCIDSIGSFVCDCAIGMPGVV